MDHVSRSQGSVRTKLVSSESASPLRIAFLTSLAMIAFAANSVLARLALDGLHIDPISFTSIRFVSGAIALVVLVIVFHGGSRASVSSGNWCSAAALMIYGLCFSLAYIDLTAGTGALILFAAVQITMISGGLLKGETLTGLQILGSILAVGGLVALLLPSAETPPILAGLLMMISGIGWGVYSLRGRGAGDPTLQTSGNFVRASCFSVLLLPFTGLEIFKSNISEPGIILAIISGAITSGLGYVIWYMALKNLSAIKAGLAQLTVPVIAAFGGILFIAEPLTLRFVAISSIILIGVALATLTGQTRVLSRR